MGEWGEADLLLSGSVSQTGQTNDSGLVTAGGISDSLMRPRSFCAYRNGEKGGRMTCWIDREGK